MKYQVGDEIIVLLSQEEGRVVEILNDKMVMIEVRGVKFPAYMDQIDFPYFSRFTRNKLVPEKKPEVKTYIDQVPKEKAKVNQLPVETGVWLIAIPKFSLDDWNDEVVDLLKIHLVNNTATGYHFDYAQQSAGRTGFGLINDIAPFQDFYLHDLPFEEVNDSPQLQFEFTLLKPDKTKATHYEATLKLKPKLMFKKIEELKAANQPFLSFLLFEKYPEKSGEPEFSLNPLLAKGYKVYDAARVREHLEPARSVIDLHIEKLAGQFDDLDSTEILGIQLDEFRKWFDLAVAHRQPSLIVIHGVGKGKLREEIHTILKSRREVKNFVNQYDPRFGYGATEIFFQY